MTRHSIASALSTAIVALGLISTNSSAAPLSGLKGAAAEQSIVSAAGFGHHGFGHHGFGGHGFFGHHHHHLGFGFVPYYYSNPYSCYPYCGFGRHHHHHHWWGHHHHGHHR